MRSLRVQLLFSHLALVFLMVALMVGAIVNFVRLGGSIDRILRENYDSVRAAQDMKEALEREDSAAVYSVAGRKREALALYRDNSKRFQQAYNLEAHNITEPGEQQAANDIGAWYREYQAAIARLFPGPAAFRRGAANRYYFATLEPLFLKLRQRVQDVLEINERAINQKEARAHLEARRASITGALVTLGALALALFFALRMVGVSLLPLRTLARQADEIGAGHWNQRIELRRTDEIGALAEAFNKMAARLNQAWRLGEQRLQRAESMSDTALASLYDPVIVTDGNSRIVHLNRAAEALFGAAADAEGRQVVEVVREPRIVRAIERAVQLESVADEAGYSILAPVGGAGDEQTYRIRATPMLGDEAELLGSVVVLENITRLRELDRLKTEFIAVASHELRTPVTSLLLSVQLLEEGAVGKLSEDQQAVVNAQKEDLDRLSRLIRDLLDVTRLETAAPKLTPVAPLAVVNAAKQAVESKAAAAAVDLQIDVAEGLPSVRADSDQIVRALVNIAENAVRHTAKGGKVRIAARPDQAGVLFEVQDNGAGIPAEYVSRIFERFVQVPGATKGGAGLGLSIAQTIVRAHGGSISVESAPEKGSAFRFALQSVEQQAEDRSAPSSD
ncbi:MAG TPA: ATP-binding protein [Chthonomonadales bacterium]|nr:ATP-binding protein [Chthonomonadales bacterium]